MEDKQIGLDEVRRTGGNSMTKLKKKKARWFGLCVAAFLVMCTVGAVHLWVGPLCLAVMIVCVRKGELREWGGVK